MAMPIPPAAQEQLQLTNTRFEEWLQGDFFTIQWWIMLALFFLTTWLWWKRVDKARLNELVFHTAIVIIFVIALDELGEEMSLWYYTTDIFPLFPPITAINVSCLPLIYMLIYQHTRSWKTFLIASGVMAVVFCFVFEPIFLWSGIYKILNWQSYYGLPIYFSIGVAARFIAMRVFHVSPKKRSGSSPVIAPFNEPPSQTLTDTYHQPEDPGQG
jgi:hypothetical protein